MHPGARTRRGYLLGVMPMRELEQEVASVANFINLALGDDVSPYYWEIAASVLVPAVYYPAPQIDTAGDALDSYEAAYMWLIKFFHKTDGEAHDLARRALMAIKNMRNVIPLINEDGSDAGRGFRVLDPTIKQVDRGAWQMELRWHSPRYFSDSAGAKANSLHYAINDEDEAVTVLE